MSKQDTPPLSLFILTGLGAGALVGALIGLAVGSRQAGAPDVAESVDELKSRAQQVLDDLSAGLSALESKDLPDDRLINH